MHPSHKVKYFHFSRVSLRSRGLFSLDIVSEGPMSPSPEDMQGVMVVMEGIPICLYVVYNDRMEQRNGGHEDVEIQYHPPLCSRRYCSRDDRASSRKFRSISLARNPQKGGYWNPSGYGSVKHCSCQDVPRAKKITTA